MYICENIHKWNLEKKLEYSVIFLNLVSVLHSTGSF